MRVIFAGTPEFAKVALERLLNEGFMIPLVLTQPDRPAGRGMKLQASPVKQFAQEKDIAIVQPHSLRLDGKYAEEASAVRAAIATADADVMVVAAYGLILPQWVLDDMAPTLPTACGSLPPEGAFAPRGGPSALKPASKLGCLNIHASLLPRWRGAAPIHRAIEAGDAQTGVTIMQMDAGLDTGDMLLKETLPIEKDDTTASLHDKLAAVGARLIVQALAVAARDALRPVKQAPEGVSYAHKIGKQEAAIDWSQPAVMVARRIRAFDPFPGAVTAAQGEAVKVWRSEIESESKKSGKTPGTVLAVTESGVNVQCGQGILRLTELQRAGGKRLSATEFLHGFALPAGVVLGMPSVR